MTAETLAFPADFLWGTATSAYQIEGAAQADGRGESIWDRFSHTPGKTFNGDTGDVACDHYHRWQDDIALLKALHLRAYRFSVAWPRILPQGRGAVNQAGLDFYSRLVDGLLTAGITPFVTLYHWDLPQALQDEGGWLRRGIAEDFADYAEIVARALGDRVQHWITLNEPWCIAWLGHQTGEHAPGFEEDTPTKALAAAHHALLAHGAAMRRLRAIVPSGQHGITLNVTQIDAATSKPADLAAAARYDGFYNRWFFDAIFRGHYPADKLDEWAAYLPEIAPGDMAQIAAPVDFLGLNYYTRVIIAADPDDPDKREIGILQPDVPRTTMGWEIHPEGLYAWLMRIHREYAPRAIYITENGAAFADRLDADDRVRDTERIAYLQAHFEAAQRALHDGAPLKGYFVWSLLDNFEWAHGYSQRFGITYVDYATQRRIVKDSGRYLAQVAVGSR